MTTYASLDSARDWGIPTLQSDLFVTDRLTTATQIVDDYTGWSSYGMSGAFAGTKLQTVTVNDVRYPLVTLPNPFSLQLASPAAPTVTPTGVAGTTTYTYQCVANNVNGATWPGIVGYTQTGNATLSGSNYNALSVPAVTDATSYTWLRVTGTTAVNIGTSTSPSFNDTGQTGTAFSVTAYGNPYLENCGVNVNNVALAATGWQIEQWGLRLYLSGYFDVDGFPYSSPTSIGYGVVGPTAMQGSPYGSKVDVTAYYGYSAVPSPVKEATVRLAAWLCQTAGEYQIDKRIQMVAVEGYVVRFPNRPDPSETLHTTGLIEVDRLLDPYCLMQSAVGVG